MNRPIFVLALCLLGFYRLMAMEEQAQSLSGDGSEEGRGRAAEVIRALCLEVKNSSRDLASAQWQWQAQRRAQKLILTSLLPELAFNLNQNEQIDMGANSNWLWEAGGSIRQLLWDGGIIMRQIALAGAQVERARVHIDWQQDLIEQICIAQIIEFIKSKSFSSIQAQRLDYLRGEIERLRISLERGSITQFEFDEAVLVTESAAIEYMEGEKNELYARERLGLLLGRPLKDELDAISLDSSVLGKISGQMEQIIGRDPQVLDAQLALREAEMQLRAYSPWYIPSIYIDASVQFLGDRFPITKCRWSAGLGLQFSGLGHSLGTQLFRTAANSGGFSLDKNSSFIVNQNYQRVASKKDAAFLVQDSKHRLAQTLEALNIRVQETGQAQEIWQKKLLLAKKQASLEMQKYTQRKLLYETGKYSISQWLEAGLELQQAAIRFLYIQGEYQLARMENCLLFGRPLESLFTVKEEGNDKLFTF